MSDNEHALGYRTLAMNRLIIIASLLAVAASACSPIMTESRRLEKVTERAKFDLSCQNVSVVKLDDDTYGVKGCEEQATYVLIKCGNGYYDHACKVVMDSARN